MKNFFRLIGLFLITSIGYASQAQLSLTGEIINPEPIITITNSSWAMSNLKLGDAVNLEFSPTIVVKAPNAAIVDLEPVISVQVFVSKTNWRGINKITVQETTLAGNNNILEIPLGGGMIFPSIINPPTTGLTISPKFNVSGTINSAGTINETIRIVATYS